MKKHLLEEKRSAFSYLKTMLLLGATLLLSYSVHANDDCDVVANEPNVYEMCKPGEAITFATMFDAQILGDQDAADYSIRYYFGLIDANSGGTSGILDNLDPSGMGHDLYTFAARIELNADVTCYAVTEVKILVKPCPEGCEPTSTAPEDLVVCQNSPVITLSDYDASALAEVDTDEYMVTYHESQINAQTGTAVLTTFSPDEVGTKTIWLRVASIEDFYCFETTSFTITVNPAVNVGNIIITDNGGGSFSFAITELENADEFTWNFGDGLGSTEENPTHQYTEDGVYTVTFTASNECGEDEANLTFTYEGTSGINELNKEQVTVFPNPTSEIVNIRYDGEISSVEIFNSVGELVFTSNKINSTTYQINIEDWTKGVYHINVRTQKGEFQQKLSVY